MRQFAHKGFRIEQLSTEAKLLYSAFLVFSVAALLVSVLYYGALVDGRPIEGAKEYYAGEVQAGTSGDVLVPGDGTPDHGGPLLDLPEEMMEASAPLISAMSYRKILEVTHFHLFTVPVFLLIIAHIFMLCAIRPSIKIASIASGLLSSAIHMAAPWIIYAGGASWAWLMPVTGTWMMASILVLTAWPTLVIWRKA